MPVTAVVTCGMRGCGRWFSARCSSLTARYHVDAFVIMPNHVHLQWQLAEECELPKELKGLKGATARACNVELGCAGAFWMEESYDRIVRNTAELASFRNYIAENPAKAKLRDGEFHLEVRNKLYVREREEQ